MKENYTHIIVIVDRSGSMRSKATDVIGGYNGFIEDQRKVEGHATVTYCQFDNQYETIYRMKPLADVPLLDDETYRPRGGTALLDAVGRTIATTGEELAKLDEPDRPSRVIVVIITDGQENSSREYRRAQVKEMIEHQTDQYSWAFVYLGADAGSFAEAGGLGIQAGNVLRYANTGAGVNAVYAASSRAVASYRTDSLADAGNLMADNVGDSADLVTGAPESDPDQKN